LIAADVASTLNAHFGDKQGLEDQHINGGGRCSLPRVSMCLNAGAMGRIDAESETLIPTHGAVFDVAHSLSAEGFDASEDGTGRGTPIVPVAFDCEGSEVQWSGDGLHPTLRSAGSHAAVAIQERAVSENMDAGPGGKGWRVRRLTPTECERLQGFPDGYTNIPYRGKPDAPDGPRYKALGNSMAVNAMRWIGRRIEMVEAL
jgi:DNA (cytosine-5)-methyltransferase 1